jgi:predicted nucleic acid-binding protein
VRVFFDTSALAKLFVPEAGTDEMNAMMAQDGLEIWVSALASLEFHSLAWRRHREGQLDAARVAVLLGTLDEQLHEWHVIGLTPSVLQSARDLLADHAGQHGLRTLDALQLASFDALLEDGPATFGCADARLCTVAALRGHATFNPVAAR